MHGIVFTGGEHPEISSIRKFLFPTDVTVAADSGLLLAEKCGVEPDLILGDMDSVDHSRLQNYPSSRIRIWQPDKDYTDTELALRELVKRGCDRITIIGGGGGRLDHLLAIRDLIVVSPVPLRWVCNHEVVYRISREKGIGGSEVVISRLCPVDMVSVFPVGEDPWDAESSGLHWELAKVQWRRGISSLSNRISEEFFLAKKSVEIRALEGVFLVTIPLGAEVKIY